MGEAETKTTWTMWGVINPWGNPWSPAVFDTEYEAREHLRLFWLGTSEEKYLTGFAVERVRVTIERIPQDAAALSQKESG